MDIEEIRWQLHRANVRQSAAQDFWGGATQQFIAALKVGTPQEIEHARVAVMAAYEAYLDTLKISMKLALRLDAEGYDREGA